MSRLAVFLSVFLILFINTVTWASEQVTEKSHAGLSLKGIWSRLLMSLPTIERNASASNEKKQITDSYSGYSPELVRVLETMSKSGDNGY